MLVKESQIDYKIKQTLVNTYIAMRAQIPSVNRINYSEKTHVSLVQLRLIP